MKTRYLKILLLFSVLAFFGYGCGKNLFAPNPANVAISDNPQEALALGEEALDNGDYDLATKAFLKIMNDANADTALKLEAQKNYFYALTLKKEVTPLDIVAKSGLTDLLTESSSQDNLDTELVTKLLDEQLFKDMTSVYNGQNALHYIDETTGITGTDTIVIGDSVSAVISTRTGETASVTIDDQGNVLIDGEPVSASKAKELGLVDPQAAASAGMAHLLNAVTVLGDTNKDGNLSPDESNNLNKLRDALKSGDLDTAAQTVYDTNTLEQVKQNAVQEIVIAKLQVELALATMDTNGDSKADDPASAGSYEIISGLNDGLSSMFTSLKNIDQ